MIVQSCNTEHQFYKEILEKLYSTEFTNRLDTLSYNVKAWISSLSHAIKGIKLGEAGIPFQDSNYQLTAADLEKVINNLKLTQKLILVLDEYPDVVEKINNFEGKQAAIDFLAATRSLCQNTEHPLYAPQFADLLDNIENFEEDPKAAFKLLDSYLLKANKKIILFIDNLAELFETFSKNEEEMLREVLSQNNNIRIIGGSAISLENFYDNKAPFYQFFYIITLKEINRQETVKLLINLGRYLGKEEEAKIKRLIEEEPEKIETIRRLTGGIPRTLILLFQILIEGPRSLSDLVCFKPNIL